MHRRHLQRQVSFYQHHTWWRSVRIGWPRRKSRHHYVHRVGGTIWAPRWYQVPSQLHAIDADIYFFREQRSLWCRLVNGWRHLCAATRHLRTERPRQWDGNVGPNTCSVCAGVALTSDKLAQVPGHSDVPRRPPLLHLRDRPVDGDDRRGRFVARPVSRSFPRHGDASNSKSAALQTDAVARRGAWQEPLLLARGRWSRWSRHRSAHNAGNRVRLLPRPRLDGSKAKVKSTIHRRATQRAQVGLRLQQTHGRFRLPRPALRGRPCQISWHFGCTVCDAWRW